MTSVELSKEQNKRHDQVMRDIRAVIKRNPELACNFLKSTYKNVRGKTYPSFILNKNAENIMREKYRFNIRNARFEYKMINELCDYLDEMNIEYICQYPILNYKIDLFLPTYNLCVEYDEKENEYKKHNDERREKTVKNAFSLESKKMKVLVQQLQNL